VFHIEILSDFIVLIYIFSIAFFDPVYSNFNQRFPGTVTSFLLVFHHNLVLA